MNAGQGAGQFGLFSYLRSLEVLISCWQCSVQLTGSPFNFCDLRQHFLYNASQAFLACSILAEVFYSICSQVNFLKKKTEKIL